MTAMQTKSMQRPGRWRDHFGLVSVALLVSFNLIIIGTSDIFLSNRGEFDTTFMGLLPLLIGMMVGLVLPLVLVGMLLPRGARNTFVVLLLIVGVLLWIQGSFIRWHYGALDGKAIDWSTFPWQGWVDAGIWLVVIGVAMRFRTKIVRYASFIALAFMIIQSFVLVTRALSSPTDVDEAPDPIDVMRAAVPVATCQVSSTSNVFHIILDSFQTDVFMQIVREDNLAELLSGFTVYRDNMSAGRRTVMSVPSVFSTNVYDGSETESEYFRKAMRGSFTFLLAEQDYVVNLMPHIGMRRIRHTNYYKPPNPYAEPLRKQQMRTVAYLVDVSLFRQLPHYAKRFVYNDQNWRVSSLTGDPPNHLSFNHKAFFRDYISKLNVAYRKPGYHFVHLWPPHPPLVTLADGSYAKETLPMTRENYVNEARFILNVFLEFLEKLKQLGAYDSSIVLLHGDHGAALRPNIDGKETNERMGAVSALLALKPAGATGALRSSWVQTSLTDIPATLMGLLGIEHPYPGSSIETLQSDGDQIRRVVYVEDRASREPTIRRWLVRGSVYDSISWHELPPHKMVRGVRPYKWGQRLAFGIAGNGDPYLTAGWSTTSPTMHWNDGTSAEMTFGITDPGGDAVFTILLTPYVVPGKVDVQRIRMSANGHSFDEYLCESSSMITLSSYVPAELLRDEKLVFSFEFPDAVSPHDIDEGKDTRKLAMGLYGFELKVAP